MLSPSMASNCVPEAMSYFFAQDHDAKWYIWPSPGHQGTGVDALTELSGTWKRVVYVHCEIMNSWIGLMYLNKLKLLCFIIPTEKPEAFQRAEREWLKMRTWLWHDTLMQSLHGCSRVAEREPGAHVRNLYPLESPYGVQWRCPCS